MVAMNGCNEYKTDKESQQDYVHAIVRNKGQDR